MNLTTHQFPMDHNLTANFIIYNFGGSSSWATFWIEVTKNRSLKLTLQSLLPPLLIKKIYEPNLKRNWYIINMLFL